MLKFLIVLMQDTSLPFALHSNVRSSRTKLATPSHFQTSPTNCIGFTLSSSRLALLQRVTVFRDMSWNKIHEIAIRMLPSASQFKGYIVETFLHSNIIVFLVTEQYGIVIAQRVEEALEYL